EDCNIRLPKKLLYACDYQALPGQDNLNRLNKLASVLNTELEIFHVDDGTGLAEHYFEEARIAEKLENSISTLKHSYKTVAAKNVIARLQHAITDLKADILLMSPHKYSFCN